MNAFVWFYLIWFGAGLVSAPFVYAMSFYYWQTKYAEISPQNRTEDRQKSIVFGLLGIPMGFISLPLYYSLCKEHLGLKWK